MLRNLISRDDLPLLLEKVRQGHGPRLLRLAVSMTRRRRVDRTWEATESPPKHWGSVQPVQRRWNALVTGDPDTTIYDHVAGNYLADRDDYVALSLACGTGAHEVRFAHTGRFGRIEGYDLSQNRVEKALQRAVNERVDETVKFHVGDVRTLEVAPESCDVVIAFNALHHISPLKPTIAWIRRVLRPGGLVIVRDYVGPDRFQWTSRQLAVADELLATIPLRYRTRWGSGSVKKRNYRIGRLAMILSDPSEAAEASHIVPLLDEHFERVETKDLGGAVLHLVLKDIAHHFGRGEEKADKHLERLMAAEDELMGSGEVGSDFVFGVWRKSTSDSRIQTSEFEF